MASKTKPKGDTPFTLGTMGDIGAVGAKLTAAAAIIKAVASQIERRCRHCNLTMTAMLAVDERLSRRAYAESERMNTDWASCDRCEAARLLALRFSSPDGWPMSVPLWAQVVALRDLGCKVKSAVVNDAPVIRSIAEGFLGMDAPTASKWRALRPVRKRFSERMSDWLNGPDTGLSSRALLATIDGSRFSGREADRHAHPHDPDDLGRCIRMLDALPELRTALPSASAMSSEWAALVAAWDEIEGLYREEFASGCAPRCYERMKAILN